MPQMYISRDPTMINDNLLKAVISAICPAAAVALSVEGLCKLETKDVLVQIRDFGPFDIHARELEVILFSHEYPERRKNLDERNQMISKAVESVVHELVSYFTWIILAPTSFIAVDKVYW